MRLALFITCFNDTVFPCTGRAVTELLERLGHTVEFPQGQTPPARPTRTTPWSAWRSAACRPSWQAASTGWSAPTAARLSTTATGGDGTPAIQWTPNGGAAQQWNMTKAS
ncbi:hypothetical protein AQJ84_24260 [Streptomyces resistomycificus]|uniref:Ricin B lectin domain-containing protein n=1 Tax=Streptomyces resistomycificus TaxID=67356 RepID=A0A0L8LG66_9ACTN|nr:hypothetical protein ADK37_12540 [Streptomyces resistomycificus]KUN95176.1 hypothetical protein AQJ84_24260 [Streptomyces resistomycificus]